MKKSFFIASSICVLLLSACGSNKNSKGESSPNPEFKAYEERFMNEFWQQNPEWATSVGFHEYDSILNIPNDGTRSLTLTFAQNQLDSLKKFDVEKMNPDQKTDYYLIQNQLSSMIWTINEEKPFEWNPSVYNVSGLIAGMLSENYAPLEKRLTSIYHRMLKIPIYYDAAKQEIRNPAEILVNLAIRQNKGGLSVFESDLVDSIKISDLSDDKKTKMLQASQNSASAIKSFVKFLENYPNPNPRSFRLGKELYDAKFRFDIQSDYTAEQIYDSAVVRKDYLHDKMAQLSSDLWSKYFGEKNQPTDKLVLIRKMIDTLSVQHVKPEDFQTAIEEQLPKLVAFVKEKNLLHIDESKPLVVRKEPAYMAGIAGASISAPGPYDKDGNTYYNVGSLEGWPKEKSESYLREYNHYILQILNTHEAIPGHYTQLVHANESPSIIKSVFANGAMIEGWAVYTEQMMLENGYGNDEPEMWLMWYKWHLRTVCNAILDYSVHVKDMTQEQAMDLLVNEAFQQKAEAEGKWNRVMVSSVQLMSYYTGYKEIYDLREAVKAKKGDQFNLKEFNEKFLSYGNAPVKYIKEMMLK